MEKVLKKESMSFMDGFLVHHELADDGIKYLNWAKAEKICLEHPEAHIKAGLLEDWDCTSGDIFRCGRWVKDDVYTCSFWATPVLEVDGELVECWSHRRSSKSVPKWWGRAAVIDSEVQYGPAVALQPA